MTLTPQQWTRVKSIVLEAMDLSPTQRPGFIAQACDADTTIRREVDALLAADDAPTLPEPTTAAPGATSLPESGGSMLVGRRVGRYLITRLIGMGGMGAVYEARQDSLSRPVALKVMRAGLISAAATARFQREAKILSRLEHPGIARIYDLGLHESELGPIPFFAMELIPAAVSLTQFAREHHLTIRERVAVFAGVCDAVHHGHQRGIVHRDLKPSNILVGKPDSPSAFLAASLQTPSDAPTTSSPGIVAKVIDFGIARSTDADMTLASFESAPNAMAGTLAYMSPEQCAFDPVDIDIRSDVYALGVVLYELLTGRLPYDVADKPLPEAIRIIQETPAPRPSTIEPRLSGDLSVILLKCLAKERPQRYGSAADLAADLRRYLADQPIAARPASRWYAARLFARRYRPLVIVGGVACAAVLVALVVTTLALWRAVADRDRAREAERLAQLEEARAKSVAEFVQGVLRSTAAPILVSPFRDPTISPITSAIAPRGPIAPGRADSLREVIVRARAGLDSGALNDPRLAAELKLVTLQLLITQIGTTQENNDLMARAPAELDDAARDLGRTHSGVLAASLMLCQFMAGYGAYDRAHRLLEPFYLAARDDLGPGDLRTLELGRQLVVLRNTHERRDDALALANELIQHSIAAHGLDARPTLACRLILASIISSQGNTAEASSIARDVLAVLDAGGNASDELLRSALPLSIADVPRVPADRANLARIAAVEERVLQNVRDAFAADARQTMDPATTLVGTLVQLGDFPRAIEVMREIARDSESSFGPRFHVTTKSQSRVARLLLWSNGDLAEAQALAETAYRNAVATSNTPLGDYEVFDRATVLDIRRERGEPQLALDAIDQLLRDYQATSGGHLSWFGGYAHSIAARALDQLHRPDDARPRWEQALAENEEGQNKHGVLRLIVLRNAARFFQTHGPPDRANWCTQQLDEIYLGPR